MNNDRRDIALLSFNPKDSDAYFQSLATKHPTLRPNLKPRTRNPGFDLNMCRGSVTTMTLYSLAFELLPEALILGTLATRLLHHFDSKIAWP